MKVKLITSLILTMISSQLVICQEKRVQEKWAIAIHGGAGSSASLTDEKKKVYEKHLLAALKIGTDMLASGESSLNAVQAVVVYLTRQ